MNEPWAFVNGRWIPASQAAVSVADAGFVLGTTVSEQLRTFRGQLFRLEAHLDRLDRSLAVVGIEPGMTRDELAAMARELARRNHALLAPGGDLGLSLFVTPGPYATFAVDAPAGPTIGMHTYPLPFHQWAEQYRTGAALATVGVEPVPPECWPAGVKCRSRMHYYLADREARGKHPGARALLVDRQGRVHDTSTATLLAYFSAEGLVVPPEDRILPGISAGFVRELADGLGIGWSRRDLSVAELHRADELLLASTPFCLLPATQLDGRPIGTGQPGDVFRRLLDAWSESVGVDIAGQAELALGS